jgi:hypothetical protein
MLASRKFHNEEMATLQPDLGLLYSKESFSTRDAMQKSLNTVDKKLSLDREMFATIEGWPESIKTRLDNSDLSDEQKKDVLTGFMRNYGSSEYLSAYRQAMVADSDWADSTHDLYMFTLKHSSQIVVTKDGMGIDSDVIREQFNTKLTRSKTLLSDYLAAEKKAAEVRAANMKRQGVAPADLGLDR